MIAERIPLPGGEVELMRPPDAEALITEESFEHEEFLPYWAELWSSAVALAHDVSIRSLRGKPTLELGCGLGLPSIAAARAGGRVLATDWSPDAVRATAANAERNEVRGRDAVVLVGRARRDRRARAVAARDRLATCSTSAATSTLLLELLPRLVDEPGLVLLADPGRVPASASSPPRPSEGWSVRSIASPRAKRVLIHRLRRTRLDDFEGVAAALATASAA